MIENGEKTSALFSDTAAPFFMLDKIFLFDIIDTSITK